ncbi:hypothetical protein ACRE1S_04085 [Helicobacter himalayensis]|uniref:hypothetical protein n=1 Tax=Helicobacter himalayensis TaxID=1591088 RepID=UPI003D6FB1C8
MDFTLEKDLQNEIAKNQSLQRDICSVLDMDFYKTRFDKETKFINGITSDFTLFENDKIKAIIECKGGQINVTDYVRGIGQIFQYEYFAQHLLSHRGYEFYPLENFSSVYIFPDSVLRNNEFNIGLFNYPQTKKILEVNSHSLAVRLIDEKEFEKWGGKSRKLISQYYIHDTRIFELYFLVKILAVYHLKEKEIHRQQLEALLAEQLQTPNSKGWRNMFITLSTLGLIDKGNKLTQSGFNLSQLPYPQFALELFKYLEPFFTYLIEALNRYSHKQEFDCSNKELFESIFKKHGEIAFLIENQEKDDKPNTRYISSYLNILRDDYGVIAFQPRSQTRKFLCNPFDLNEKAFLQHIEKHSIIKNYQENFQSIFNEI